MADARPANRIELFEVVAPAGTAKASPLEVSTQFNPGEVVRVEIVVPDGPNYLAGIRLAVAHAPVIPATAGGWITANDERLEFEMMGYPTSGAWSAFVYNSDIFAHTFRVRYQIADFVFSGPGSAPAPLATPIIV